MAIKLRTDKVFIIPTRSGGLFLVGTLVMLILGAGYSNNLINLLGFFMLSLLFVSMTLTNFQVKELSVEGVDIEPSFAEGELLAHALIKNPTTVPRFGINPEFEDLKVEPNLGAPSVVRAQSLTRVPFAHVVKKRGQYVAKRLEMNCVHPVGLFYAWKYVTLDLPYFVYPKPISELPLPNRMSAGNTEGLRNVEKIGGDDFRGHRSFVPGDSARHIDWKAYARGRPFLVKELNEGDLPDLILDWDQLGGMDTEARLSQLTAWILEAFRTNLSFSLKIPKLNIKAGLGSAHAQKCLEALAVYAVE